MFVSLENTQTKRTLFMINPVITPEAIHVETPTHVINMGEMDAESIAFMLSQSRDGFYSNKELAPIREYSTNALDSHIEAGIPTTPIEVTLPSQMEPELKIRDFGKGLSESELERVYFKYWKSTKRNTNEQNGFLGIGSKSAMAYSDVYTIISICDGMKMIYTAHKKGVSERIYIGPNTNNEPSGIEVIIPVQQKDISKFVHEALNFFQYWDVKPIFKNIDSEQVKAAFNLMETKPFIEGDGWSVRPAGYGNGRTVAIMANVGYTIDWEQVKTSIAPQLFQKISGIFTFLQENITTLYFSNGTLSFTPNRESLQYNEITVTQLSNKLLDIFTRLLNLITEKIADAPNLWEAKIRYNQIFRKELDGFDKSIAYSGNLSTVETVLRNRIEWNGITIKNGYFEEMENWCLTSGKLTSSYDVSEPMMTTYVKNEDKTNVKVVKHGSRRRRRYYAANVKIICSPKSVVVIQDTEKNSLAKNFARWILFKSGMDVLQVYVLNLSNPKVKEEFYKYYNFETVPVKIVSENELLVKSYLKSIRAPRGTYNTGERESRPIACPFMEIKNRKNSFSGYVSDGSNWDYEEVNPRNIDGGGYYVVYTKKCFVFNGQEISHENSNYFWQAIYNLSVECGVSLPKVYGIHPKTAESVWFKQAVEDGDWTNISEFITENAELLPKDMLKTMAAYENAEDNRVGTIAAKELLPMLTNPNGTAGKFFDEIAEFIKHWDIRNIVNWLSLKGFDADETETERFKTVNAEMRKKYPLLFKTNANVIIENCNEGSQKLEFPMVRELAEYINLVDMKA